MFVRSFAVTLACVVLAGCGVESLLQRQVTATVDNSSKIGGDACPLLVATAEGEHLEVTLPDGYSRGVPAGVTGPSGLMAGTGDLIRIAVTSRQPAQSPCKWGTPVEASRISRP